ncbi:unnamed protein product, partial [Mesorhabditis spiculigera]
MGGDSIGYGENTMRPWHKFDRNDWILSRAKREIAEDTISDESTGSGESTEKPLATFDRTNPWMEGRAKREIGDDSTSDEPTEPAENERATRTPWFKFDSKDWTIRGKRAIAEYTADCGSDTDDQVNIDSRGIFDFLREDTTTTDGELSEGTESTSGPTSGGCLEVVTTDETEEETEETQEPSEDDVEASGSEEVETTTEAETTDKGSCDVRRQRSSQPRGLFLSVTIIISFHPMFVTKVDRSYNVQCFYTEVEKTVSQQLDVGMSPEQLKNIQGDDPAAAGGLARRPANGQNQFGLDDGVPEETITSTFQLPTCRYEVLTETDKGEPVKFATVGQHVYHRWSCEDPAHPEAESPFCATVHSCNVREESGKQAMLLDENGCSVDKYLLTNLVYTSALTGKRSAQNVTVIQPRGPDVDVFSQSMTVFEVDEDADNPTTRSPSRWPSSGKEGSKFACRSGVSTFSSP